MKSIPQPQSLSVGVFRVASMSAESIHNPIRVLTSIMRPNPSVKRDAPTARPLLLRSSQRSPAMSPALRLVVLALTFFSSMAWGGQTIEARTSLDDIFRVTETDYWNVKLERNLLLRFTDIRVDDKQGYPFSLMLYFKADTPDLAQFDSPAKMERSVRLSSEKYLPAIVEKSITLKKVPVFGSYGFYTVLTDKEVAQKANPQPREFKYLTRGMVRLSKDSALAFSLMTNDIESPDYKKLLDYVYSFVKPGSKS